MPSGTRIPKPKTKKLGHKITSLYRSTKLTQLHDVGIIEIISSGDGASTHNVRCSIEGGNCR